MRCDLVFEVSLRWEETKGSGRLALSQEEAGGKQAEMMIFQRIR